MRLVLATVLLALLPAAPASAVPRDECAELVVDHTGLVDVAVVRRAALRVQQHAADIRVRVFDSVPGGDLDEQERADRRTCATWHNPNGSRRDNLIVLSVSVGDRRVGLYYGRAWARELGGRWTSIQSQSISPLLKQERWTDGLVAGLRTIARVIDPMHNPTGPGEGEAGIVDGPGPVGTTGGGGPAISVLAVLGLVVVGGLTILRGVGRFGGGGGMFLGGGAFRGGSSRPSGSSGFFSGGSGGSRGSGGGGRRGGGRGGGGSSSF